MTESYNICLSSPKNIVDFCYTAGTLPRHISIKVKDGNKLADGRSILSMLSLTRYNKAVTMIISSERLIDEKDIEQKFNPWIMEMEDMNESY